MILKISKGNNNQDLMKGEEIVLCWNKHGDICKLTDNNRKLKLTQKEKDKWLNINIDSNSDNNKDNETYSYFLTFGASIAMVKMIKRYINIGKRRVFVGFDSGDFIEIK